MRIALIPGHVKTMDINHNMAEMKKWLDDLREKHVDLLVFGEAFLQGFGAINADCAHDFALATQQKDACIQTLKDACLETQTGLAFGYIENAKGTLYSSVIVINEEGEVLHNFRRASPGWKIGRAFEDERYQEGKGFSSFDLKGKKIDIAICGDLWHDELLEQYEKLSSDLTLWPLYTNYRLETWEEGEKEAYAQRVKTLNRPVLMVNSFDYGEDIALGGAFVFENGQVMQELPMGTAGYLLFSC